MERCGVCSEKNYCSPCSHCDKRVCSDCKESHLDILRREIARVNNQVRRTLPRLQDALSVIEKNTQHLEQNCNSVIEEVVDIHQRLSRSLKERMEMMKSEVEIFLAKEQRHLATLKENLIQEISNFDSNSEFADKHMAEGTVWDDCELMDTKEIFLRTMEFIRNFESEPGDYHRKVRFFVLQDTNQLANTLSTLGELTIHQSTNQQGAPQPPSAPTLGPGLMRSKSDHRVAAQFRQAEERYSQAYGSDNNDEVATRRYFGDARSTTRDRFGSTQDNRRDYEYESDMPDNSRRSRFKSRFMRHLDSGDSDNEPSNRSVRFNEQSNAAETSTVQKKERVKVLDTEDATRGPLSGITRLLDSPRVLKRIQEMETKKKEPKPVVAALPPPPPPPVAAPVASAALQRRAARQVSEEDEISKIKKQNKGEAAAAAATGAAATTPASTTTATTTTTNVADTVASRKPSTTSAQADVAKPVSDRPSISRQSSGSEKKEEAADAEGRQRRRSDNLRNSAQTVETAKQDSPTNHHSVAASQSVAASTGAATRPAYTRTLSNGSANQDDADRVSNGRSSRVGKVSTDRFKAQTSSESSTSAESSRQSSPVRSGAAFSTDELRNRYLSSSRKNSAAGVAETTVGPTKTAAKAPTPTAKAATAPTPAAVAPAPTATRSRFGTTNPAASSTSTPSRFGTVTPAPAAAAAVSAGSTAAATTAAAAAAPSSTANRFQSRFLGRAGTPTAEASRGSENSSSSSSDDSSESESDSDHKTAAPVVAAAKDRELGRTDIGPLLARSAQARDSSSALGSRNEPSRVDRPTFTRSTSRTAPSPTTTSTTAPTNRASGSLPGRYGTDSAASSAAPSSRFAPAASSATGSGEYASGSSSISRSRTGSALHADATDNKYPLTSKYLNRSRASMAEATPETSTSSYTPRYGGYRSRFLNKSKSSAALAPERDDEDDDGADSETLVANADSTAPINEGHVRSNSSNLASGEERYPSGRSRYVALKDRRSRLARSKSSHEVAHGDESNVDSSAAVGEVGDTGTSSQDRADPETGSGSSLSTWARYLKNKYGPRNKDGENSESDSGNPRFGRSRSNPGSFKINGSADTDAVDDYDNVPPSPTTLANFSHSQYMQKRKIQIKFGTRGSEPGLFTWPRGVAVGPDNSIVVADSSNHRVQVFDSKGRFVSEFGHYGNGEGEFDCLAGVAINRIGQFIIADRYNLTVS